MTDETPEATGLLLPEGARLLHVGPHRTGTTSLQAALWAARPAMLRQGVRHIGKTRHPSSAVRGVLGKSMPASSLGPTPTWHWRDLVGQFRRAREPRVVLSSELLAWATPDVVERIAADLDADRLHVAVTLRPLGRILPSQWQQNVQTGARISYDAWLRQLFGTTAKMAHEDFWWLHRHDDLVARWAGVLGTDRVVAIVVDEQDHGMLLRTFAEMLGLREGTIVPHRDLSNRSMTLEEVEAVRAFNEAAHEAGVDRATFAALMRFGATAHMKLRAPGPDEARIDTPQWALDRAREADESIVAGLIASGVRIVGDLSALVAPQRSGREAGAEAGPALAPPRVAAEMAMGIALASGLVRRTGGVALGTADPADALAGVSPSQLASVVAYRSRAAAMQMVHRGATGVAARVARRVTGTRRAAAARVRSVTVPAPGRAITAAGTSPDHPATVPGALAATLPAALPAGTRILHIGPPKTGSTSLQAAFWAAREAALAQGVRYAGKSRHSARAILAATRRKSFDEGQPVPSIDHWTELLAEIRGASEPRVVLSSEGFAYASQSVSDRILAELDPALTHVVVTLRPLGRLLASEWQEHAQSGLDLPLEVWLHNLFHEPAMPMTASFWRRQRHDALIERWAGPIGRENVTVIVVDDRDHDALLRTFEALCGLRTGTLVADRSTANRSLTLEEITAVRALRERWEAEGLSMASFHRVVRMKVAAEMKLRIPGPDEPRIETPQWALDRAAEIAGEIVAGIRASGVRVIGDLERLREVPRGYDGDAPPPLRIPPAISASMAMGVLAASGVRQRLGRTWIEPIETARFSTRALATVVAGRAVAPLGRRRAGSGPPSAGGQA